MKIVITGATGFVGSQLAPIFRAKGAKLLLVGRDTGQLSNMFPGLENCTYDELAEKAAGFDAVVHCAVANTDSTLSEAEIFRANVDLVARVADAALRAGIRRFIHLSSFHALDEANGSIYARSKRASITALKAISAMETVVVYMPAVHGSRWAGKLAPLNSLPKPLARTLFNILAALKPVLAVEALAEALWAIAEGQVKELEVILADDADKNIWYRFFKRSMDIAFALAVIVLLGWAMLIVWAIVRWQSPGPGIFAQERVGKHGKVFTCYKFRTMQKDTMQGGTHEVSAASVTRIGAFLRRTKIDELPQVWNILKNEMSLVGPRPCLPVQKDVIEARREKDVLRLDPGITGLAQINEADMSDPRLLATWDHRYGAMRSVLLDLKIVIGTIAGRGQGDRIADTDPSPGQ